MNDILYGTNEAGGLSAYHNDEVYLSNVGIGETEMLLMMCCSQDMTDIIRNPDDENIRYYPLRYFKEVMPKSHRDDLDLIDRNLRDAFQKLKEVA